MNALADGVCKMTEIEKFDERLTALEVAIDALRNAAKVDRKLTHDKHHNEHFIQALNEMTTLRDGIRAQRLRFQTIGR